MTPLFAALALFAQPVPTPAAPGPDFDALLDLRAGDEACGLFDAPHRALLDAALARARDDRVRAGADPSTLDRAEARRDSAAPPDCEAAALAELKRRHEARAAALAGYSDLTFPGVHRDWVVDRGAVRAGHSNTPRWRIAQRDGQGQAWFGVYEHDGRMQLALAYNSEVRAARAGLMFRDADRQAHPLDFTAGGLLPAPDGDPAASWGAPAGAQARVSASSRLGAELAANLAPAGGTPARGFAFSMDALQRVSALAPRESLAVELRDATGQVTERYWFEIGALRAAMALQAMALSPAEPAPEASPAP